MGFALYDRSPNENKVTFVTHIRNIFQRYTVLIIEISDVHVKAKILLNDEHQPVHFTFNNILV